MGGYGTLLEELGMLQREPNGMLRGFTDVKLEHLSSEVIRISLHKHY